MAYGGAGQNATDLLSTPSGYASPQQIEQMNMIAKALVGQKQQPMQSWFQVLGQMANAAVASKYMNQANQMQRGMAGQGLGGGMPGAPPGAPPAPAPGAAPGASGGSDPYSALFANPNMAWNPGQ